jgi:hypothetical protein
METRATRTFATAEERWEAIGPYYAMFPSSFADHVVRNYTRPGQIVFDPFAGRGTSIYSAAKLGRSALGIEINPVGWVYSKAKLFPSDLEPLLARVKQMEAISLLFTSEARNLPDFFHYCFSPETRRFLLACRQFLKWKTQATDWTLAAIIMVYLHGKTGQALSNQMRQTKSMAPNYAIKWWQERGLCAPDLNPRNFLEKRILWRYAKGKPQITPSQTILGDSLKRIPALAKSNGHIEANLLLTSPPYCGITNYYYDQWLRLWSLGFLPIPYQPHGRNRNRFTNQTDYAKMLNAVFTKSAKLLSKDAIVYVRTDCRKFTRAATLVALKKAFPQKTICARSRPVSTPTQTALFGDHEMKIGEIDFILHPN